jgi:hypothetical protein
VYKLLREPTEVTLSKQPPLLAQLADGSSSSSSSSSSGSGGSGSGSGPPPARQYSVSDVLQGAQQYSARLKPVPLVSLCLTPRQQVHRGPLHTVDTRRGAPRDAAGHRLLRLQHTRCA